MVDRWFFGIANGITVILWCFMISSTWQTKMLLPKWLFRFPNENLTGIPNHIIALDRNLAYPTKLLIQRLFGSPDQLGTSRLLMRTQTPVSNSTEFFCNTNNMRSSTRPTSVHKLRPGDVDVIGSIGDSLTAGTGSLSYLLPQLLIEHRGMSWTAGGQGTWREFLTLPNILKVFNPKLIGYAYGDSLATQRFSQFNVAEPGALSKDLLFMSKELVKRIKEDKRVNFNEDWKLISILMGSNSHCLELCYEDYTVYANKHKENLFKSLIYLKEHLPRTMVNLVTSLSLEFVINFTNLPLRCVLFHIYECPCLFAKQYKNHRLEYLNVMKKFQDAEKEIVEHEELKNKDDFAVVLQTFTENLVFPRNKLNYTDTSYLASDCFHCSQKGYARANALWNNMMEPVGKKSTNWSKEFDLFRCPTNKSPYIYTWKNSII